MKLFEIKNRFTREVLFSAECGSLKLCVEAAVNGCVDLSNSDLRSVDLRNANLRSADLSDSDLRRANLHSVDLHNANLSGIRE